MEVQDEYIDVAGVHCIRYDTSALEGWLMMHGLRRVICGGESFPYRRGKLAVVASQPLMQKEVDFIGEMYAGGGCPPIGAFLEQMGRVVGVVDFEVVQDTNLPGWDGTPNPVILSNPHWFKDGILVPVQPDVFLPHDRQSRRHQKSRRFGRNRHG